MDAAAEMLRRAGDEPADLLAAPPPNDDRSRSYCPRCCAQFHLDAGECAECCVTLQAFDAPDKRASDSTPEAADAMQPRNTPTSPDEEDSRVRCG